MRRNPTLLAFDTSAAHCAAALLTDGRTVHERHEALGRGQAERLMPMLEDVLAEAGLTWRDLDAIGVGIGPGNFTGIRISVAAARGLGLALGIPVVGVSTFEIMRGRDTGPDEADELVSVEAPRGQAYIQHFTNGLPQDAARLIDVGDLPKDLGLSGETVVTGHRADEIAAAFGARARVSELAHVGECIAQRAAWRLSTGTEPPARPVPLYVRAPDAAPPKHDAPVILDA